MTSIGSATSTPTLTYDALGNLVAVSEMTVSGVVPAAHATSHQPGGADALAVNAAAGTGSLRTLGTSSTSACAGNDSRLSDSRAPTGSAGGDLGSTFPNPTVLKLNGAALPSNAADGFLKRNSGNSAWEEVAYGSAANTVCQGNDARLSDTRTPAASAAWPVPGAIGGTTPAAGTFTTLTATADIVVNTAGNGLKIKEGSNARMGTSVLVAGTVVVSNTSVTASTRIFLTTDTPGGTQGFLSVSALSAGTSFTISSSNAADTSTVAWLLVEPA